jgi:Phage terminase large subunit (GpA)
VSNHPGALHLIARRLAEMIRPPERIPLSRWLAENLVLVDGPQAGELWNAAGAPYLPEIADCLSDDHPCSEVSIRKAQQTGASILALGWCLQIADREPANTLYGVPGLDALRDLNSGKLQPLIDAWQRRTRRAVIVPQTSRSGAGSTTYEKVFTGGRIWLANANSVMDLSSKTAKKGVKDEVSKWQELDNGADPETLFFGRFTAFRRTKDYKILAISTPEVDAGEEAGEEVEGHCRIDRPFRRSDQRFWNCVCPECQKLFVHHFERFEINAAHRHLSVYPCIHCGHRITDAERVNAIRRGRFFGCIPVQEIGRRRPHRAIAFEADRRMRRQNVSVQEERTAFGQLEKPVGNLVHRALHEHGLLDCPVHIREHGDRIHHGRLRQQRNVEFVELDRTSTGFSASPDADGTLERACRQFVISVLEMHVAVERNVLTTTFWPRTVRCNSAGDGSLGNSSNWKPDRQGAGYREGGFGKTRDRAVVNGEVATFQLVDQRRVVEIEKLLKNVPPRITIEHDPVDIGIAARRQRKRLGIVHHDRMRKRPAQAHCGRHDVNDANQGHRRQQNRLPRENADQRADQQGYDSPAENRKQREMVIADQRPDPVVRNQLGYFVVGKRHKGQRGRDQKYPVDRKGSKDRLGRHRARDHDRQHEQIPVQDARRPGQAFEIGAVKVQKGDAREQQQHDEG